MNARSFGTLAEWTLSLRASPQAVSQRKSVLQHVGQDRYRLSFAVIGAAQLAPHLLQR